MTAADYSSGAFFHYSYDAAGNRLTQETHEGTNTYLYDAKHRITQVDGVAYTWDPAGNLLSDGDRTFAYDHADRLTSIIDGSSTYAFAYDGLGNRYQESLNGAATTYSLDIAADLTQVLGDGTDSYLYGMGRIGESGPDGWQYPLTDALGSARQLADASASITLSRSYEPFGAPLRTYGDGSSAFGFTGEQDGVAGLVFLRARYYDPGIGRFITKDPFPGVLTLPSTLHPYQYALNNPINLVDPSGKIAPILVIAALGFAAGFGLNTWMQYQANGGWCGYELLPALGWGVAGAVTSVLGALTILELAGLAGLGLQGLGVTFGSATVFGWGTSVSAAGSAAAIWLMTGQKPWSIPSNLKALPALPAKTIRIGPKELESYPPDVPFPRRGVHIVEPSGVKAPKRVLRANWLQVNPGETIPPGSHMHHINLESSRHATSRGENLIPLPLLKHIGGYGTGSVHSWWWGQGVGSWTPVGTQIIIDY